MIIIIWFQYIEKVHEYLNGRVCKDYVHLINEWS